MYSVIQPKIVIPLAVIVILILLLPQLGQYFSRMDNHPSKTRCRLASTTHTIRTNSSIIGNISQTNSTTIGKSTITTKTDDELVPTLPPWTNRLGDFSDFRFLMNSNTCGQVPVYALLLVGSHPNNRDIRDVIRLTWGNPQLPEFPFKLIFPFGRLTDQNAQLKLEIESRLHGDIIQGNFIDSYNNATLRDLMTLRWTRFHCQQAQFVVHVDDDISFDVFSLVDILQEKYSNKSSTEDFISCMCPLMNSNVYREGRYEVSRQDHPSDLYDPYCLGWLYVLNPAMARLLDDMALVVKPYWLNDAYITGTLIKAANRKLGDLRMMWTDKTDKMEKMLRDWNSTNGKPPTYLIGPHGASLNTAMQLHKLYREFSTIKHIQK